MPASEAATPDRPAQVTATAAGPWPGTDVPEATRAIRGELGSPHLPFLPELPARGPGADAVGRTASVLVDLPVDLQPHGWRLVPHPGRDSRRGASLLASDINVLADTAGTEEQPARELKLQLRGPLSLAANLYLHSGERVLLDAGARRELADSLAAGLADHLRVAAAAVPGARLVLQLDEPELESVLAGTVPTASGYRTLRAVARAEVAAAWERVLEAARTAGAAEVALIVPAAGRSLELAFASSADAAGCAVEGLPAAQWETVAGAVESGKLFWAGVVAAGAAAPPQVSALVAAVEGPWRRLGLPVTALPSVRLTTAGGLEHFAPSAARQVLTRLTATADALDQIRHG
ncbi:hypothetical protein KIH31_10270 [Paenarthrobacter sp. DKR-5]|uniref:hypothetical protein n=1 Tax=Paenarthrobacter sp. DKR-5 TaxID=2835535 RepID=UPI001BDCA933|nr:hypothetical protein [Paenarthrobacter sp. DKR-5]MBT1002992.1 hypothetical protein [Paenarthrobacter sp. DKR-5]